MQNRFPSAIALYPMSTTQPIEFSTSKVRLTTANPHNYSVTKTAGMHQTMINDLAKCQALWGWVKHKILSTVPCACGTTRLQSMQWSKAQTFSTMPLPPSLPPRRQN